MPDVADAMDPLKLVALDRDDIEIISAHLQDAIVKVADVHWRPDENRFVAALGRFDWEAAYADKPEYRRRLAALRFDRVLGCSRATRTRCSTCWRSNSPRPMHRPASLP